MSWLRDLACHLAFGVRFCETGQPSHLNPGTGDRGRAEAEAAVGSSHCLWGTPGEDIWDRGGPGERRGTRAGGHCVGGVDLEAVMGGSGSALESLEVAEEEASPEPGGREGRWCAAQGA